MPPKREQVLSRYWTATEPRLVYDCGALLRAAERETPGVATTIYYELGSYEATRWRYLKRRFATSTVVAADGMPYAFGTWVSDMLESNGSQGSFAFTPGARPEARRATIDVSRPRQDLATQLRTMPGSELDRIWRDLNWSSDYDATTKRMVRGLLWSEYETRHVAMGSHESPS